jgi:hypothetical protein
MRTSTFTKRNLLATILSLTLLCGQAAAQNAQTNSGTASATAAVTEAGARFTAPGEVLQIRLEIYAAAGELVYDSGQRAGDILDWKVSDVQQGIADGSYLCVVTFKDLRGRASRRLATLNVQSGGVSLARARSSELSAAQSQKIAATDADESLAILRDGKERAVTVATHDGQDGQVTSTTGALTFRTGDVLTGHDKEQMRVTPEGRVGIGTDKPEATLDVAGTIRARGGIRFDDGTVLTSAGASVRTSGVDPVQANIVAGSTGTANRVSKWLDGAGTLGDSSITETGGNVGIGTLTPTSTLDVSGTASFGIAGQGRLKIDDSSPGNNLTFNVSGANGYLYFNPGSGFSIFKAPTNTTAQFQVESSGTSGFSGAIRTWNGTSNANAPLLFYTSGQNLATNALQAGDMKFYPGLSFDLTTRIGNHSIFFSPSGTGSTIVENGNVGIGTSAPTQKLEVAGSIKLNGANSKIFFADGTSMSTAGGGASISGSQIVSAINDPATVGVIGDNRLSSNVARLGGANAWSGANVFGAGLSANNSLITNVGNPVGAGDATNKAYVDANFVRFVPGAEQLSVGDANGTAPMINLRGGSTCCSGPGGHTPAFFKVFQNGSFVATGNLGIGVSPLEGKGYRTSWYTYKGAFRSGYADNEWDDANTGFFSWAGGSNSTASGLYAFAFGDTNFARSTSSIAFGSGNEVKGAAGFSAGAGNRVCDTYGVAFGNKAQSGGPLIDGKCDPETFNIRGLAAVAMGYNVTADQDHTTALGKFASNNGFSGTFIWSDGSATASADTFRNTANNEFAARASGGFRFRTNLTGTTGCNLPAGSGVFNCTSSRYTKENFMGVSGEDVLTRLRKVPVTSWNYISEGQQVRHLGPMAEDFYGAFGLGTSDKAIGVQDLAGINLAAAQALDQRTAELQKENAQLRTQLTALEQRLAALEQKAQADASGKQEQAPRR